MNKAEKHKENNIKYYKRHRERINAQRREKYLVRGEDYLVNHALKGRERNARIRNSLIELLGGVCVRCGFSDKRALQVDHVNGGGVEEVRAGYKGNKNSILFDRILSGSKDYQLLCANCNWIKRFEKGETNRKYC